MKPTDWRQVFHLVQKEGRVREAGPRVQAWRQERGWTLARLGEVLALDKSVLSKIENGKRGLSVEEALRIAEVFDKTLADLLLPDATSADLKRAIDAWALYDEAEASLAAIRVEWDRYERAVMRLRALGKHESVRAHAESLRRQLEEEYRPHWESELRRGRDVPRDLSEFVRLQDPTPAGLLTADVLSDARLPSAPWAYRGRAPAHVTGSPD